MKALYQVSGYLRENPDKPYRETGEFLLGRVIADTELDFPCSDDADIHVGFLWKVTE